MRILHLTSHLDVGGITTYVVRLSEGLQARGHQVVVASDAGLLSERVTRAGLTQWHVPLRTSAECSLAVARTVWRVRRWLLAEPVELIHAHTRVAQVAAHALWSRTGIPYVTTWHGFYRRRLSRRVWPCPGCLPIAISEPVAAHLRDVFRVPPERIRVIPHGIEMARFTQRVEPSEQQRFREQVGLAYGGPVIGTVARLVESKGVAQLLASLREVTAQIPHAQALIGGDGDDRARLERVAQAQGLAQVVRFAGSLPETRVALSVMDVFVFLPARQEGFGLSLLEAMASARPIVAIRRGAGAPWVLEEAGVGVVVEPDDPRRLAEAITCLLRDPERARALGAQALAVAKARYDDARMIEQVEQVYGEAIRSR